MAKALNTLFLSESAALAEAIFERLITVQGRRMGAGAGMIWSTDGLVLTNNHVLSQRRDHALVTFADNEQFDGEVLARDAEVDLALLRIEAEPLEAIEVGDSTKLRIGELVYAIGHPWGQRNAVTAGVVSHMTTAQTDGPRELIPIIRTDARLAPGNSGGPLVNTAGQVVGINTMIVGGDQGMAIPSAVALEFVNSVIQEKVAV